MNAKKSFVIYFDALPALSGLDSAQRGELFSALCDYARRVSVEPLEADRCLKDYPALKPRAQMAFLFMAGSIGRDTEKWKSAQQRRQKFAQERAEQKKADDKAWMDRYI